MQSLARNNGQGNYSLVFIINEKNFSVIVKNWKRCYVIFIYLEFIHRDCHRDADS